MIDIFITAFQRKELTGETLRYLKERTQYPFRLFLIDNGENEGYKFDVDHYIQLRPNMGIHAAWNVALSLAESEYFITSDNDIYVPDLKPDWLAQMVQYMDERPNYAAISLHPHVFIGAASVEPNTPENVVERNMCGAVMRIMRTEMVREVGGWEHKIEAGRNHEERWICQRLQNAGYRVGVASRIRAFHPFPPNWGYDESFTPEQQKHNPDLKEYVTQFNNKEAYDNRTWMPK